MRRAIIYCRVSSVQQVTDGHGLESQEHRCREYARQRGYEIECVFRDSVTGGGDFWKRPAMTELFRYLDDRPLKDYVVIFDDLKRFARDTLFHWKLRREFQSRNTQIECLNFNFEDTPEGEFVETIMAAQGQLERQQNRRQVIQKQRARLEKGYWPFYQPPGYRAFKDPVHGKLLKPVEPQASIIREALEGYASGRFQEQVDVQKFLQNKKYHGDKPVYLETVKRLLTRVVYAGWIEYEPWDIPKTKGFHEALISLETYQKIQSRLSGKVRIFSRKDTRSDFLLRGFILCNECRKPYTGSWSTGRGGKFPYYRCNTVSCHRHNKGVRKEIIDKQFANILQSVQPRAGTIALSKAILIDVWDKKIKEATAVKKEKELALKELQVKKMSYVELIPKATSSAVIEAYEEKIDELSNKELALMGEIEHVTPQLEFGTAVNAVFELLKNPYSMWEKGSLEDKRLVLKLVFAEQVVYDHEKGFETPILSLPLRAFQLSDVSRSQLVEVVGIEPTWKAVIQKESP